MKNALISAPEKKPVALPDPITHVYGQPKNITLKYTLDLSGVCGPFMDHLYL